MYNKDICKKNLLSFIVKCIGVQFFNEILILIKLFLGITELNKLKYSKGEQHIIETKAKKNL